MDNNIEAIFANITVVAASIDTMKGASMRVVVGTARSCILFVA